MGLAEIIAVLALVFSALGGFYVLARKDRPAWNRVNQAFSRVIVLLTLCLGQFTIGTWGGAYHVDEARQWLPYLIGASVGLGALCAIYMIVAYVTQDRH